MTMYYKEVNINGKVQKVHCRTQGEDASETAILDRFGVTYKLITDGFVEHYGGLREAVEYILAGEDGEWTEPLRSDVCLVWTICKKDDAFRKYSEYGDTVVPAARKLSV